METENLKIFVRAAELGSITRAAEELGYTQSASSHILSRLEKGLGVTLLKRTRDGVILTPAGKQIIPMAKMILSKQAELQYTAQSFSENMSGLVRIGSVTSVAVQWLPEIISRFTTIYNQVKIQIRDGSYSDVERWLSEKQVDCGFLSSCTKSPFLLHPLKQDALMLVLPKKHPLCKYSEVPLHVLSDEKFLIPAEGLSYDVGALLREAHVTVIPDYDRISDYSAIALVKLGYGITIMPQLLLNGYSLDGMELRRLRPNYSRTLCLAMPSEPYRSRAVETFAQFTIRWIREETPEPKSRTP